MQPKAKLSKIFSLSCFFFFFAKSILKGLRIVAIFRKDQVLKCKRGKRGEVDREVALAVQCSAH